MEGHVCVCAHMHVCTVETRKWSVLRLKKRKITSDVFIYPESHRPFVILALSLPIPLVSPEKYITLSPSVHHLGKDIPLPTNLFIILRATFAKDPP